MNNSNILISLSAYKEAENIVKITDKIRSQFPTIKILIINDESYDNTEKLIQEKNDENITIIQRQKKFFYMLGQETCQICIKTLFQKGC